MYPDANADWNERLSMSREPIEAVLESALSSYQLHVEIITSARYCGDWVDHEPETVRGQFHLIEEGQCLVSGSCMRRPIVLSPGDFIVFPWGVGPWRPNHWINKMAEIGRRRKESPSTALELWLA